VAARKERVLIMATDIIIVIVGGYGVVQHIITDIITDPLMVIGAVTIFYVVGCASICILLIMAIPTMPLVVVLLLVIVEIAIVMVVAIAEIVAEAETTMDSACLLSSSLLS